MGLEIAPVVLVRAVVRLELGLCPIAKRTTGGIPMRVGEMRAETAMRAGQKFDAVRSAQIAAPPGKSRATARFDRWLHGASFVARRAVFVKRHRVAGRARRRPSNLIGIRGPKGHRRDTIFR